MEEGSIYREDKGEAKEGSTEGEVTKKPRRVPIKTYRGKREGEVTKRSRIVPLKTYRGRRQGEVTKRPRLVSLKTYRGRRQGKVTKRPRLLPLKTYRGRRQGEVTKRPRLLPLKTYQGRREWEVTKRPHRDSGCLIPDEEHTITFYQNGHDKIRETPGVADSGRSSPNEVDENETTSERLFYSKASQKKPTDDDRNDVRTFASDKVRVDQKQLNELWAEAKEKEGKRTEICNICTDICCDILEKDKEKILNVWPAYESHDKKCIVFVIITKEGIREKDLSVEYSTVVRPEKEYSNEATKVAESEENKEHNLSFKESESIRKAVNNHAKELMRCHKNLSVISGSGVRSKNFNRKGKHEIIKEACIVLFVPIKGTIPLDETEFPKCLDGIPVDVREGEFQTCASATEFQHSLQMGCQIKSGKKGTLGGFVDHPIYGLSAITCAHVVLNNEELHNLSEDSRKVWRCNEKPFYQPDRGDEDRNYCGQVKQVIYESGSGDNSGVDLAILQIEKRAPDSGAFPDVNNTPTDMVFETGKLCFSVIENFDHVLKFGCATNKTEGIVHTIQTLLSK